MHKIYSLLSLFILIMITSCEQNELNEIQSSNKEVDVKLTACLPQRVSTYSNEDNSHNGGINNVDATKYDLRFIIEYYEEGTDKLAYRQTEIIKDDFSNAKINITNRLLVRKYDVLCWADFVKEGEVEDNNYNTSSLKSVSIVPENYVNIENISLDSRDAYCGHACLDLTEKDNSVVLTLKRPFAKLRFIAIDQKDGSSNRYPTSAKLSYTGDVPSTFDVLTGNTSGKIGINSTLELCSTTKPVDKVNIKGFVGGEDDDTYYLLGNDYIFASSSFTALTVGIACYDGKVKIGERAIGAIPLNANKLTTVYGNLYTNKGEVKIAIEDDFEDESKVEVNTIVKDPVDVSKTNGVITIFKNDLRGQDHVNLVVQANGNVEKIIVKFENDEVAQRVNQLILDLSNCKGSELQVENESFTGDLSIQNYFGNATKLGDIYVKLPNGGLTIEKDVDCGNVDVWASENTFNLNEGAIINGYLTLHSGRGIVDGIVRGIITVKDAKMKIKSASGAYDNFSSTGVLTANYTKSYGFGLDLNTIVGFFYDGFTVPDFLNIGWHLNYAGVVGVLDFNNTQAGYTVNQLRNVELSLLNGEKCLGTAKLKKPLNIDLMSLRDLTDYVNKPINEIKDELKEEMADLVALTEMVEHKVPNFLYRKLLEDVLRLQLSVDAFVNQIPALTVPSSQYGIPFATIMPDGTNFDFQDINALIGTPEDKFDILKVGDYVSGKEKITIYMLINLVKDIQEAREQVIVLKEQIAPLQAESDQLVFDIAALKEQSENLLVTDPELKALNDVFEEKVAIYDGLQEPVTSGGSGFRRWFITPAVKNPLFKVSNEVSYFGEQLTGLAKKYTATGLAKPDAGNLAKMNAKNAAIDEINKSIAALRAAFANKSGVLNETLKEKEARLDVVGKKSDITKIPGLGSLIDGATSPEAVNAILKLLGYDIVIPSDAVVIPNITDYIYTGELGPLYLQLFQAEITSGIYDSLIETLGIPEEVIDALVASAEYLDEVVKVVNKLDSAFEKVENYNPWVYSYEENVSSFNNGIDGVRVDLEFEYVEGKKVIVSTTRK